MGAWSLEEVACFVGCDHCLAGPVLSTELTQWHSLVCGEHKHTQLHCLGSELTDLVRSL